MTSQPPIPADARRAAAEMLAGRTSVAIVAAMSPQLPTESIRALLMEARERGVHVTLSVADITGRYDFLDEAAERDVLGGALDIVVLAGAVPRRLAPVVDCVPSSMWDIDRMLRSGELACDVLAVRVAGVQSGLVDLGHAVAFTPGVMERAGVRTMVEVSSGREYGRGYYRVPLADLDAVVWYEPTIVAPATADPGGPDPVQVAIARNVAALVPADATIQLGIGRLADALAVELAGRPHLGLHTGTIPTAALAALQAGAFRGSAKSVDPDLQVATGLATDAGPGPWAGSVRLRPVSETHAPGVLSRHECLWALNSAFEVDLFGQVSAEWAGGHRLASGGGQTDFVRAAHQSARGAAVIALPSRSSRGASRIVAALAAPGSVTTTANDIDYVVTEFGVARLRGATLWQRWESLARIAHPDDRAALLDGGTPQDERRGTRR